MGRVVVMEEKKNAWRILVRELEEIDYQGEKKM